MASGISARVSGLLALGNQVTTNSSACSTGTEALALGAARIRSGLAERMLCGGAEGASHYIWAGFDAMRVLARGFNDDAREGLAADLGERGGLHPRRGRRRAAAREPRLARERAARASTPSCSARPSTAAATAAAAA